MFVERGSLGGRFEFFFVEVGGLGVGDVMINMKFFFSWNGRFCGFLNVM